MMAEAGGPSPRGPGLSPPPGEGVWGGLPSAAPGRSSPRTLAVLCFLLRRRRLPLRVSLLRFRRPVRRPALPTGPERSPPPPTALPEAMTTASSSKNEEEEEEEKEDGERFGEQYRERDWRIYEYPRFFRHPVRLGLRAHAKRFPTLA